MLTGRVAGMVRCPRATLAELADRPAWVGTWLALLTIWGCCGGWLLSTDVGQQALVDERVRVVETWGGEVGDEAYEAWQEQPPWWVYFTSGSRLLIAPPATLLVAALLLLATRLEGRPARFDRALTVAVHASIALLVGQVVATPLHYVRESLTSPFNLAAILPLIDEGTMAARFFGALDAFVLWWMGLLAIGMSVLTGRRTGRYVLGLVTAAVGYAAMVAAAIAAFGGT